MSAVELRPPTAPGGTWYQSSAPEKSKLVVTNTAHGKPGVLHRIIVQNKSAAVGYAFVFDGTSSSGTLILSPLVLPAHGMVDITSHTGIPFSTGIFVGFSTSDATYTLSGTDDAWWTVGYHVMVH